MEKAWKTSHLAKGEAISTEIDGVCLTVSHVDRTVDPYLAGVMRRGEITYSGLHRTLADARQTCERKAKEKA